MKTKLNFRYLLYPLVVLMLVGCSVEHDIGDHPTLKPVTPIKRRPIVPGHKVPRPRVATEEMGLEQDIYATEAVQEEEYLEITY